MTRLARSSTGDLMRYALNFLLSVLVCTSVASESVAAEQDALQIEIQSPSVDFTATSGETSV